MKKKIFIAAAVIISSQLHAQDSTKSLNEIVVTATKLPVKQSQTGKVVTVITKEQIEKSSGKTVAQILNEQAGITINGALNNAGSVQTIYMRGAASGRTLILLDGIPVSDPSMINNEFDLNFFSVNDVERIEICKGAQSTLYGSDAVAGVINIITIKKDVNKPFNFKTTLSAGSLNTFKGNFQVYGKADKFSYTARYAKLVTNGFSSAYDSTGKNNFDKDGYNGDALNASVQYQATNTLLFKAFSQFSQYTAGVDASAFTDRTNYNIHNKIFTTGTGFKYQDNEVVITGNYQYSTMNRNFNDNASVPNATSFSLTNFNAITQFVELFVNIKASKNFDILTGTDYRYGSYNGSYKSNYTAYNSNTSDTSLNQNSLFASLHFMNNNKKLNIELGGRFNSHSRYGTNYTFTFNPSYSINKYFRVFGSIASGFKAPSIYQLYDVYSGNKGLQPEKSINYEIGTQLGNQKLSGRLVYFKRDIKNGIDYNYNTYQYFNFVKQLVQGAELEINYRLTKKLSLSANYTLLTGTEESQSRTSFNDTTYSYLLRRPKNNFNITAGYQFSKSFFVSISGKSVSKRYDVGGYDANFNPLPDVVLNAYFLLGAYAEYKLNAKIKCFVDLQNITNKKFFDVRGYNSIPFLINGGVTISL